MKILQTLVKSTFTRPQQQRRHQIGSKSSPIVDENTPPGDPNIQSTDPRSAAPKPSKSKSHKKSLDSHQQTRDAYTVPDRPVTVMVRIMPSNRHERAEDQRIRKVSDRAVGVGDREFSFDSVLDSCSNQEDVFRLVGEPLVKDALAGYNASILSYGQSGSGKTYTMSGPQTAMIKGHSMSSQRGIAPRIFQMLFSEIHKEKVKSNGKLINFQLRCSFLEIYDGQRGDLLDPSQRNFEIMDDVENGLYVENLCEEYVTSYDDVTQILIKGLANRKVGTTSLNSKSSRSHILNKGKVGGNKRKAYRAEYM